MRIHSAKIGAGLGAVTLVALGSSNVKASTVFSQTFAPQEGLLTPAEKPFRDEQCLNGSWQFQPIALPEGFQQGKSPVPELPQPTEAGWEKTPIKIPSPWNVNGYPDQKGLGGDFNTYPSYPEAWKNVQMGWLRRSFTIPAAWKGRRLILHFNAVAGSTQIVVNGKTVATHADNFLPFDADITDAVQYGTPNTLMVGVRRASLTDVQGKYGRRTYQGGSMWGQHIAGIWQDVFLEARPTVHIANVFVKPFVDRDTLETEVTLRNETDQPTTISLSANALPWISQAGKDTLSAPVPKWKLGSAALQTDTVSATIPAGGTTTVTLTRKVENRLKFWSPESPNLYAMVCRLKGAKGAVSDVKQTRFGWRQVTFQGSQVLLNGKQLIIKGDSWHFMGIPQMTRRYAWAWYKTLHDANLNAVRLHAQPYPEFYLDMADEMGILVLDESAVWASDGGPKVDDPAFWKDTETHVQNLVLRDRNHPSVFGWSISNELMAVVRGVFHAPKEQQDEVIRHYTIWADICRKADPSRTWISADGEDDGNGTLPTYIVHYGGTGALERASKSGKPWGVGEAGPAYYGTPEQIAQQSSNPRSYLSFQDRMEGVATASYQSLTDQRKFNASFRSVFNLVWYGLKPLELGMRDTTRPPALTDGITFPAFVEGRPGVQPERLGPYCTTLNPGYDPKLPIYATWPLFDAIRNAQAEPNAIAYKPAHDFTLGVATAKSPLAGTIKSVPVLSGSGGTLSQALADLGVPVASQSAGDNSLLFVDGAQPPDTTAKPTLEKTLNDGGTVVVWGANASTLARLNTLLPETLELTERTASSLVTGTPSPITSGITPASLYFSELSPAIILPAGLGGPLVRKATTLLAANNTDWMRWNRQPETTKTAMVLRSEREAKPSGAALVSLNVGKGHLIVCGIPISAQTSQATTLNRALLTNLGIALGDGVAQRNVLDATGTVTRALAAGRIPVASVDEGLTSSFVAPNSGSSISVGSIVKDRAWTPITTDTNGAFDLQTLRTVNPQQSGVIYFSFWLYSPKALDNLLLDPHLPNLDLATGGSANVQVWVNGKPITTKSDNAVIVAQSLPLQQGWSHVLVKVVQATGETATAPAIRLKSSQPDYLTQLRGAQEKPL